MSAVSDSSFYRLASVEDAARTRLRRVVRLMLALTASLLLILLTLTLLMERSLLPARFVAVACLVPTLAIGYWLLHKEQLRAATAWLAWGALAAVSAQAFATGGLNNPALFAFPMLVLLAGSLLGPRQALGLMLGELLALALITWARTQGLHPVTPPLPIATQGLVLGFLVVMTFAALRHFLHSHREDLVEIGKLNGELERKLQDLNAQGRALQHSEDELRALNQVLERRVQERTQALSEALATLQAAQQDLVQAEKLTAMGSLVAGVAHELNTPIGNALASASTLGATVDELKECVSARAVRRSELLALAERLQAAAQLTERSVHRAAQLVQSFKQVAVDQASERRRKFELGEMLDEVLEVLRPNFRHRQIEFHLEAPGRILMDSFPGALSQVVLNLTMNAALHAFEGRPGGTVTLRVRDLPDGWVELVCQDDGVGMSAAVLRRVFEPFFTTRLGKGGSGLGLSIARNLCLQVLGGRLEVEAAPEQGSRFTLTLPVVASEDSKGQGKEAMDAAAAISTTPEGHAER